jgi:hypothetical protein
VPPQHVLAGAQQVPLEAAVDVAAVLKGEARLAVGASELMGPGTKALVAGLRARHGQLAEQSATGDTTKPVSLSRRRLDSAGSARRAEDARPVAGRCCHRASRGTLAPSDRA